MANSIHLKSFGMIAEKIGAGTLEMPNPGSSDLLKAQLFERFPELKSMKFSLAIDKKMIQTDTPIPEGAEIALLPPFSGG